MRIIAGAHRGRRILAPSGRRTRPMLERVRESLFDILQADVPGARVLDLFSGSGSLGLEALSRGAERVRFVERGPDAWRTLRRNVDELALAERCELVLGDALQPRHWEVGGEAAIDLVLVDSPYALLADGAGQGRLFAAIAALQRERMAPDGWLVLHAPARSLAAASMGAATPEGSRTYGTSQLWFFRPEAA